MTQPILFGNLFSSYVRTTILALEEKGVAYEMRVTRPHSEELVGRHPFGKVPAFEHGDVRLCETLAIVSYVNEAFDGPALAPKTPAGRGEMLKWIGLLNDVVYTDLVKSWALQHLMPRGADGKPDLAAIEAALPKARRDLEVLERALEGRAYLAGDALSLADLFLVPMVDFVPRLPGGVELMAGLDRLGAVVRDVAGRPSYAKTVKATA
jgi:glutathione S-transferase